MTETDHDTLLRVTAFDHVRKLSEIHDHLTAKELKPGFIFNGERIPLVNPQRGIFKPRQMLFLLSIKTVFPKPGAKVWYDDQRKVHRQNFESEETVDYAFMGKNPEAADNRWLREAFENQIPVIYFLGIAPGRYQAMLPAFISGWDGISRDMTMSSLRRTERGMPLLKLRLGRRVWVYGVILIRCHRGSVEESDADSKLSGINNPIYFKLQGSESK